ncbi:hypothetical protein FRC01_003819 [Tulasnella sp. 417]|nr:hypothetical protein FRC01_003819 [Tulasnella sp. 417]
MARTPGDTVVDVWCPTWGDATWHPTPAFSDELVLRRMDELQGFQHAHRRGPHGKRLLKHGGIDSPLYDASEEDNDGRGDEASSFSGPYIPLRNAAMIPDPSPSLNVADGRSPNPPLTANDPVVHPTPAVAHGSQSNIAESLRRDRADSPTYDGDVESSTAGYKDPPPSWNDHRKLHSPTGEAKAQEGNASSPSIAAADSLPFDTCEPKSTPVLSTLQIPTALSTDDIRAYVQAAIDQDPSSSRTYKPKSPPKGRPIRVYADGVYDIFHFGSVTHTGVLVHDAHRSPSARHALQLRQAKLSFPSVHLMVGVCSDELCSEHKSRTVMSHAERCESVRHCRWVDEILPDAPWVVDQAFIDKHRIDYVAHDDDPYKGSDGSEDVYHYVKTTG